MLLQFFVDEVQVLHCRADGSLLMSHARELRAYLVQHGMHLSELPKLVGAAGRMWFKRWRLEYGIVMKAIGMKLKVSWRKVRRRVRVLLQNFFRFLI